MLDQSTASVSCKTVFLSDIHLGFADCKADYLLEFLHSLKCETLYLVGDIIDFWALKRRSHWPKSHGAVLSKLVDMSRSGVNVIYIPGNHDDPAREFVGAFFENIKIQSSAEFHLLDGRKLLVSHGDELDHVVRVSGINAAVGDMAYGFLLTLSRWTHGCRRLFGRPFWSLSAFVKTRVPQAAKAIALFEHAAAQEAIRLGYDGIICGHLHVPKIAMLEGVLYCNDGDWIDSCSSLIETHEGELKLLHWADQRQIIAEHPVPLAAVA